MKAVRYLMNTKTVKLVTFLRAPTSAYWLDTM